MQRVLVTGNNRTKKEFVGLKATVKRSVGLGGWHWLVLPSGEEIKLQRNALLVLEHPSGNEPDFPEDARRNSFKNHHHHQKHSHHHHHHNNNHHQHQPPVPPNGEASPAAPPRGKREATPSRSAIATAMNNNNGYAAEFAVATHERRVSLRQSAAASGAPRINLSRLNITALRKYSSTYHLPDTGPQSSREQLLDAVARHFTDDLQVDELSVIRAFMSNAHRQATFAE